MKRHGAVPKLSASSKALLLPLVLLAFIFFLDDERVQLAGTGRVPEEARLPAAHRRADLYERRHLLRMVYGLQLANLTEAHVDVRFVFCRLYKDDQRVLVPLEILAHSGDVIVLDGCNKENLHGGKTYAFLSAVAELFADEPRCAPCHGRTCTTASPSIPCDGTDPFRGYMSGMGYVLSWDLVRWIATSDVARNNSVGVENVLTGKWLQLGGKGKNRFNAKPAMHDYLNPVPVNQCERPFTSSDIAVHRLKTNPKWAKTLKYFNFTAGLKSSKFYKIIDI
ncbi:hypothetical protein EJB05_51398, partial [Eragrostis curvula]